MRARRGNPNFTKPEAITAPAPGANSFEEIIQQLKLTPDQYLDSRELKDWVLRNKDHKYVPTELLQRLGLSVKLEL